jgi:hypothetical protein
MSSGPEGEQRPSQPGRIDDGSCSDSYVIQEPLTLRAGPYMTVPSARRSRACGRGLSGHAWMGTPEVLTHRGRSVCCPRAPRLSPASAHRPGAGSGTGTPR